MTPKKYVENLKKLQEENWTPEKVQAFNKYKPSQQAINAVRRSQHTVDVVMMRERVKQADQLLLAVYKEMNNKAFWDGGTHGLQANITEYLKQKELI